MKTIAYLTAATVLGLGAIATPARADEDIYSNPLNGARYHYIGVGGNIGISDNRYTSGDLQGISQDGVAINGKISLRNNLSIRPSVTFGNDSTVFMVPLTYDFNIPSGDPFEPSPAVPFIGAGMTIDTASNTNSNLGLLVTGGLDYRVSRKVVANASANASFQNSQTDWSVLLGLGYMIP
jgi:hypothetical protein